MRTQTVSLAMATRARTIAPVLVVLALLIALLPTAAVAQDASPEASVEPAEAACESVDDLTFIVEFLRETDAEEDGWLPVLVGSIAGIAEARDLAGYVGQVYQPLVEGVIVSLQDVRTLADEIRGEETAGAQLVVIGETITDIGTAMDDLSTQLQTRCPSED